MRIVISGIPIDVQKKNIKNMHLQVKPPDGHVVISAPLSVDDKAIEAYARTQLGFIKRAIAQFQEQPRASRRQYVSGETMYIWGKQYFLVFKPDNQKNSFEIQNQNIVLSMSVKSTVKQRDAYVKEEYRKILKEEIEKRLPKWEAQTGLKCDSWQTKYMVTKWGACSTGKKKLWFNLQLAQKPYACLDYIILHELTHLITRKHDATFIAHMDKCMPNWREIRKELNDSRLDYYEAQDESPLQKLIDQSRYDDIRDAAIAYIQEERSGDTKRLSVVDMEIENVIHIEQPEDGQYVRGYSFEAGALGKNQTFTIPYADLFKAYCFDREFKKLIDSGQFVFTDRHLVLNNEKYIARNQAGNATLSEYALTHMDECCVVFSKGYSYQSKYQGMKYYTQFMRNAAPVENQVEYSFELNTHNRTLLDQIQNAKRRSEALRKYPGSFAETLVALQKGRKLSNKQLADRSLVGEKTIQRLRNDEEYPTSVQTVLALCVGLKLPLPEAEMFLGKTDFKLNSLKGEGYVYQCVMGACAENSIYEINEMLKENGITPLGSDPDLQ